MADSPRRLAPAASLQLASDWIPQLFLFNSQTSEEKSLQTTIEAERKQERKGPGREKQGEISNEDPNGPD